MIQDGERADPPGEDELAELRARLEEAEQALEAIRGGAVDGLVVPSASGDRVFTLEGAERPYRDLVEAMTDGAALVTEEGRVLYANPRFAELLHAPLDDLAGSLLPESLVLENGDPLVRLLEQARAGTAEADARALAEGGEGQPLAIVASPLRGDALSGFCLIVRDLTPELLRRRAEEAERQWRALADAVPIILFTADGDGQSAFFNRRWYEYTDLPPDGLARLASAAAVHEDDRERIERSFAAARAAASPWEQEYRLRRGDGVYRWHLGRSVPVLDGAGRITRWMGAVTDIEDRKRIEEEVTAANRMKDEFLATVSHELRTPLNAMLGWARLLRMGTLDEKKRGRALATIERNATAQVQIIEDILDTSRIITGRMRLEPARLQLRDTVEAAIDVVRPAVEAKEIVLVADLEAASVALSGDAGRLQQVFWNLLVNAVKFTPRGGRIEVTARQEGPHVRVTIADSGEGIDPGFLRHVFERFRQADNSASRAHGGLGLGLAIVRHIVELHGGEVSAESPGCGRGSTFIVSLPVRAAAVAPAAPQRGDGLPAPASAPIPRTLEGMRILVVDDEPDARDLLAEVLGAAGATSVLCADAREGDSRVASERFDVIVSDIAMPGDDGFTFIARVRARGVSAPAIALSAYSRGEDERRAIAAGFDRHVAKPIDPGALVAIVAAAVRRA